MMSQDLEPGSVIDTDVVIIGGGPAGCAAALTLLSRNYRVSVVEVSDYQTKRIGEVVSTALFNLVDSIGLSSNHLYTLAIPCYESYIYWGTDAGTFRDAFFSPLGANWHLDRTAFDRWFAQKVIEKGGQLFCRTKLSEIFFDHQSGWQLLLHQSDGINIPVRCKFLIDASGKKGVLVSKLSIITHRLDRLLGISAHFDGDQNIPPFFLIESTSVGWWYAASLPGGKVVVTLMTDTDIAQQLRLTRYPVWQQCLRTTKYVIERICSMVPGPSLYVRPAHTQFIQCLSGNGWMATGDAVLSFDPLSSIGIGHALSSGIACGSATSDLLQGQRESVSLYHSDISRTRASYILQLEKFYREESRWGTEVFWKRRRN